MIPFKRNEKPTTDEDALRLIGEMYPARDMGEAVMQNLAYACYMLNRQNGLSVSEAWAKMLSDVIEHMTVVIENREARS